MVRILDQGVGAGFGSGGEYGQFAGMYRCDNCGAVVELTADDILFITDSRHRVHDFDGKGRRIRFVPNSNRCDGCPACKCDAWLWQEGTS